jgi:hypothetical protein
MLRANNARHYTAAPERVRGKTPGRQIIPRGLVHDYAKKPLSEFRATARDLSASRPGWKIHGVQYWRQQSSTGRGGALYRNKIYIRHVLTHQDYDAGEWKK